MKNTFLILLLSAGLIGSPSFAQKFVPILDEDSDILSVPLSLMTILPTEASTALQMVGIYSNPQGPILEQFLNNAKKSVDVEIYEMDDPGIHDAFRSVLAKNIQLRVVKDEKPIGEICSLFSMAPPTRKKVSEAVKADCVEQQNTVRSILAVDGNMFVPFNKTNLCGPMQIKNRCYQHGKIAVIDEMYALISSGNFNRSSVCDLAHPPAPLVCNRDYSYITRDREVVSTLKQIVDSDLKGDAYDLKSILSQGTIAKKITVSPYSLEPLTQFIQSATKTIQIENQYIRKDSGLVDVLLESAAKGVHIEVLLADECAYGSVKDNQAYSDRQLFAGLDSAGIGVKMFPKGHSVGGRNGYLHAKVIVVDGERAWVGSVNGSSTSLNTNREFGIFFNHRARVKALSDFLTADFSDEKNISWEDSILCHNGSYSGSNKGARSSVPSEAVQED